MEYITDLLTVFPDARVIQSHREVTVSFNFPYFSTLTPLPPSLKKITSF
jgi:hypothetical protein